jgi:predicted alpha/beta hydrolase family esterase
MLARLLQFITLGLLTTAAGVFAWQWGAGRPGWAVLAAAAILGLHSLLLAIELLLVHLTHGRDPAPRAAAGQLLRAWWAETIVAVKVFAWRQPFRSRRWPDRVPAMTSHGAAFTQGRGVVLVHGFVCNRGVWNPWLERLTAGDVPFVAPSLEPVFGSIDAYLAQIDAAVLRLEQATGQPPVVVAHSMGGLAVRRWLAETARSGGPGLRVAHVITLGTPHQGTWLARLAVTRNSRQMRQLSGWLRTLAEREAPTLPAHFTCFYSHADNIVFPPSTATLPGANNVFLTAVAHVEMVDRPEPWQVLQHWLQQTPPAQPPGNGTGPDAQRQPAAAPAP